MSVGWFSAGAALEEGFVRYIIHFMVHQSTVLNYPPLPCFLCCIRHTFIRIERNRWKYKKINWFSLRGEAPDVMGAEVAKIRVLRPMLTSAALGAVYYERD